MNFKLERVWGEVVVLIGGGSNVVGRQGVVEIEIEAGVRKEAC